jgi:glycosyltransferase involved in cell wall biosynthesis
MISTGHILTELLVELSSQGVKTSAICAQPTYYSSEKLHRRMTHEDIEILRTWNTQYDKNSWQGKVFNTLTFFFHALIMAMRKRSCGPLVLVTNPPFLGIMGPLLLWLQKRPFLMIVHDLYPDIAVAMGFLKSKSPVVSIWRVINRWIFRKAVNIIVLGRDVREVVLAQIPQTHHHKVVYIPNWANSSLIFPVSRDDNPFIEQLELKNKFIVQYSGNMGLTHDMESIIEAAVKLQKDPQIHFLLIGGGGKLKKLRAMVHGYGLKNSTFIPYQPREKLAYSLGASHASIISLENEASGLSVPSKLYGILASGRPIIAVIPENSEAAMTIKEAECGLIIPPKDVEKLVEAIIWMKTNPIEREEMGQRAYETFVEKYTIQHGAQKYFSLIENIT